MSALPDLVVRLELPTLMAYGAATWDWHRMHYDAESARARGFQGPVVDGQMFGALIARQIRAWAGNRARFVALEFRNRGLVIAPSTVTVVSRVASRESIGGAERIEIHSEVLDEAGRRVVDQGRAILELPQ